MTPPETPYQISIAPLILDKLKELSSRARNNRRGIWFQDLVTEMDSALRYRPTTWGEPKYWFENLGLQLFQRGLELFYVNYAVDEVRRIVYVQDFGPMPGGGLELIP